MVFSYFCGLSDTGFQHFHAILHDFMQRKQVWQLKNQSAG
ncbi:hypothetical protein BQ1740_0228 [Bacillus subtilis]|nr:hypothetical protein BQ1740_0228 [Bacillus subtilis]